MLLVCAWLWLPSIDRRRGIAAGFAVVVAALVAVPAAALIDPGRALIDYRHWDLLSANGISFRWDQSYGPLDWPQKGTLLIEVSSEKVHYWKATNLDIFDGVRWARSTGPNTEPALGEPLKYHPKGVAPSPDPEWVDRINFEVRGLTSDVAIGAGTTLALRPIEAVPAPTGSGRSVTSSAREIATRLWSTTRSRARSRCAPRERPIRARRGATSPSRSRAAPTARGRSIPRSGASPVRPRSPNQVQGTPYEVMYALARRLAAGARTPYDAAHRIELYLRSNFEYRQDVPNRTYPLPAFISEDRAGYCQQFSGAMALMLRMLGIPSRVAAGFSPGGRDPEHNNYLVDDTDAHNWVEVFFPTIGWVTFEPTPPAAPAATQVDDNSLGVTDPTPVDPNINSRSAPDPRGGDAPAPAPQRGALAKPGRSLLEAGHRGRARHRRRVRRARRPRRLRVPRVETVTTRARMSSPPESSASSSAPSPGSARRCRPEATLHRAQQVLEGLARTGGRSLCRRARGPPLPGPERRSPGRRPSAARCAGRCCVRPAPGRRCVCWWRCLPAVRRSAGVGRARIGGPGRVRGVTPATRAAAAG